MADYDKAIPNGTMRIRDTGGWVEFWFLTSSSTWNNEQTWHALFDGAWHDYAVPLARGGSWQKIASTFLTARQSVTFRIDGAGLGWPTSDHTVFIERARPPDPPKAPVFGTITQTSISVAFAYNYDGGLPILEAQIGAAGPGYNQGWQDGDSRVFTGLYPGTEYLFFGRVRNAAGWSKAGAQSKARTKNVPDAPKPVIFSNVLQESLSYEAKANWDGGTPIREFEIGYGTDPVVRQTLTSVAKASLSGLLPGRSYYFWSRVRNDIGWSAWSPRTEARLTAGAWVKNAGVWKRALPWVRVGGVWKIARPNIPINGVWKVPKS